MKKKEKKDKCIWEDVFMTGVGFVTLVICFCFEQGEVENKPQLLYAM